MSTVYQVVNQALQNASFDAQQHSIKFFLIHRILEKIRIYN